MISRKELVQKANDVCEALIAGGMDYDDARFATMALGKNVLGNDNVSENELVKALQDDFTHIEPSEDTSFDATKELPDFDAETAVDGIE